MGEDALAWQLGASRRGTPSCPLRRSAPSCSPRRGAPICPDRALSLARPSGGGPERALKVSVEGGCPPSGASRPK
eukprot:13577977-Alexandrium_andersonii.AAC.1